jgi:spore germination protein GerM
VIGRLVNQALAGVNYLLTIAVSVVVVLAAIVAFRSLVADGEPPPPTTTTTHVARVPAAAPVSITTTSAAPVGVSDCARPAPRSDDQTRVFRLYYPCGKGADSFMAWVYRAVDTEGGLLTRTLQELAAGPTVDERADGFHSTFSRATAGAVLSVTRDGGDVVVDLRDLGPMPGLAVSSEGAELLASLNGTLFQHDVAASVEYRIEGSCERFWEYFGVSECRVVTREAWEADESAGL